MVGVMSFESTWIGVEVINKNVDVVGRFTSLAGLTSVESHLVFRHPVPMKFALAQMSERVKVHHLDEVEALHKARRRKEGNHTFIRVLGSEPLINLGGAGAA